MLSALHTQHGVIADVSLAIGELLRELAIKIGAVGDQDNGRARKGHTLHHQAGEEEHGEALTATCRAKVGASLAVTLRAHVLEDVLVELLCRIVLGIAAENLFLCP